METKEQKKYEIVFLARGEEDIGVVIKHLHRLGAEILSEEGTRLITLAYPIKKNTTAHFSCIHLRAGAEIIGLLKEALKFEDGILRHLITTPPFIKESTPVSEQRGDIDTKKRSGEQLTSGAGLSNEDLEIKLQEIKESLPE